MFKQLWCCAWHFVWIETCSWSCHAFLVPFNKKTVRCRVGTQPTLLCSSQDLLTCFLLPLWRVSLDLHVCWIHNGCSKARIEICHDITCTDSLLISEGALHPPINTQPTRTNFDISPALLEIMALLCLVVPGPTEPRSDLQNWTVNIDHPQESRVYRSLWWGHTNHTIRKMSSHTT